MSHLKKIILYVQWHYNQKSWCFQFTTSIPISTKDSVFKIWLFIIQNNLAFFSLADWQPILLVKLQKFQICVWFPFWNQLKWNKANTYKSLEGHKYFYWPDSTSFNQSLKTYQFQLKPTTFNSGPPVSTYAHQFQFKFWHPPISIQALKPTSFNSNLETHQFHF